MKRQVGCNVKLLKKLVVNSGKSIAKLAEEIGVSESLLRRLVQDKYNFVVKEESRIKICIYFHVSEGALFPVVGATKERSAS
jgi:transcriptional regulator with XRE-family HTH domain